ncbi:hypothetical protein H1S01_02840 [Heliobacterium chlorum]|uniref:Uncharacterized protein n=1 Tax=Heliobacterium chlorum TaxID=2698 RepID=A0ABR7SY40_HELCL|nr:hypothetical protein [Heliobacterium chlorum]MBC9783449.1 hypothetical protein [Heliobacterium chlorum]
MSTPSLDNLEQTWVGKTLQETVDYCKRSGIDFLTQSVGRIEETTPVEPRVLQIRSGKPMIIVYAHFPRYH